MTYCDCMDCMRDGVCLDVKEALNYQLFRLKSRKNTKRTGLDAFLDEV